MNYKSISKLFLLGFILAFMFSSCTKEGPMGPAGADGADGTDGTDGVDGQVTCLVCHSGSNMEAKQGQFWMSAHAVGAIAVDYAGGRQSCAQCHSHEGFVQYATLGEVLGDISNPSAWECNTCHGLHETFEGQDYALRMHDAVSPLSNIVDDMEVVAGFTMDLNGNSNLCANCHQSRRPEPNIESPGDTYRITSTHYGPHHGAQANVVYGTGFAEIEGSVAYPTAGGSIHLEQASCTGCHMGDFTDKEGGHSFIPSVAACNECHDTELEDYNYGGVQTEVEELLVELRDQLIELGVVAGDDTDGYHPVVGTFPMVQVQAFFNWTGLEEDRSLGVHNPKYVKALLLNSIEAMEAELSATAAN
ncbi:Cytochrome c7 [Draconibacterium orientale]|jgi:hypothetical protein|uniref:Cytochrome c7 n=2 Tax=Draconibacterium orientale TaxID=1168034 RepID=A0A1H9YQM7_9BACT|nr:hypothetical protein [Draconibacterium orientale]SES71362.1 Cytochrome c7 [Draconibacterium orientale]